MKQLTSAHGIFGPFNSVQMLLDRYLCDGIEYGFDVVGAATIDDYVAPPLSASELTALKEALMSDADDLIASIYSRWTRFQVEYDLREAAARAFKAGGYAGDPGTWVTAFAGPAGMTNAAATDLIISQADALHGALPQLGALRMSKYAILTAATESAARSAHSTITSGVKLIVAALP